MTIPANNPRYRTWESAYWASLIPLCQQRIEEVLAKRPDNWESELDDARDSLEIAQEEAHLRHEEEEARPSWTIEDWRAAEDRARVRLQEAKEKLRDVLDSGGDWKSHAWMVQGLEDEVEFYCHPQLEAFDALVKGVRLDDA